MYDSLYRLATRSTYPRLTQRTVKTGTSIYQPRPTSATRNDRPAVFNDSTDLSYLQRSSSCFLWLDRPQLPATIVQLHSTTQPTATCIKHLAVSPRLDLRQLAASNIQLRASTTRPYQLSTSPILLKTKYNRHGLYTHVCKSDIKLSLLLYLLPRFCFLHCLWLSITRTH